MVDTVVVDVVVVVAAAPLQAVSVPQSPYCPWTPTPCEST